MMADVKEAIEQFIAEELADGALDDGARLIDEEIIDSLGIFILIGFIEDRFSATVEPEEVILENFETVQAITDFVTAKLG